jgi:hypothetical protein
MRRLLTWSFLLSLAGCTIENDPHVNQEKDTFFQEPPADVDILWVVDNSPSMVEEQVEVGMRFAEFIRHLQDTNIDFHLGIITTDVDSENELAGHLLGEPSVITAELEDFQLVFNERVQVGVDGSDKERGLEAAYMALTEPMISDANAGFLRRDAVLSIIFVSDENDCSDRGAFPEGSGGMVCYDQPEKLVPIREFINDFRALKDDPSDVIASAIVGPEIQQNCEDTVPGSRYLSVAGNTGGVEGNICDEDFTEIMEKMGLSVSGVRSSFQLSSVPKIETLEVYVGDAEEEDTENYEQVFEDEVDGWTYDSETNYITFHGDSVPARGTVITVYYDFGAAYEG